MSTLSPKNDLDRVVDKEIIQQFAKEKGLELISTSSKTNDKIEELFEKMAEQIYENRKDEENKKQNNIELKNDNKSKKGNSCTKKNADI